MQSITEGRNDDTEYDVEWQQWQKCVQRDNQRRTLLFNVAIKRLNVRLHITSHQTQSQDETSCICKVKHLIIIGHFSILVVNSFWEFIFFLIFINLFSLSNRFKFNHEGPRGSRTFLWWVNILSLIVWIHVKTQLLNKCLFSTLTSDSSVLSTVCNANMLWQEQPKTNLDMVKDAFWDYYAKATHTAEDSLVMIRQSELGQEVK